MHILWVSAELPDRQGQGGQRRQFHQLKALIARGHNITVLVPMDRQISTSLDQITTVVRPRLRVRGRAVPFALSRMHRMINDPKWEAVIVAHHESAGLLPDTTRAPVLVDLHNVSSHWHRRAGRTDAANASYEQESLALARADAIATCSELESARLIEIHNGLSVPVFVAPLGVDVEEWPMQSFERERPLVALFGGWFWAPNRLGLRWFAAEVWPRVRARCPEAEALVAGKGVPNDLTLPTGMTSVGHVDDLAAFTSAASVVAVPVLDGVGAAVKFAESLASGAPVVATPDGANAFPPLLLPESTLLVSSDPERWAEWIARRLIDRGVEPSPSFAREHALSNLTWNRAVAPIDTWLSDTAAHHRSSGVSGRRRKG